MHYPKKWVLFSIAGAFLIVGLGCGIYFGVVAKKKPSDPELFLLLKIREDNGNSIINLFNYYTHHANKTLIEEGTYGVTSFAPYANKTIFYGTTKPYQSILSTSEDFKKDFLTTEKWTKSGMAVDHLTRKVYIVDKLERQAYVVDIKSEFSKTLLSDLEEPSEIILDEDCGFMFVLQQSSIIQAYMNGEDATNIIKAPNLKAMTIDPLKKVLYYSDGEKVKFHHYTNHVEQSTLNITDATSLSFIRDRLFYIQTVSSANPILASCAVNSNSCRNGCCDLEIHHNRTGLETVMAYNTGLSNKVNPCEVNNSGCEQLCLLKNIFPSCACNDGWKLRADNKTCYPLDHILIRTSDSEIQFFDPESRGSPRTILEDSTFGIVSFDSYEYKTVYYATTNPTEPILSLSNDFKNLSQHTIEWIKSDLAVDDVNGKVYVVDRLEGRVNVADMQGKYGYTLLEDLDEPSRIALAPESGLMFIKLSSSVIQANMDGTDLKVILSEPKEAGIEAITVDRQNQRLYFVKSNTIFCYEYLTGSQYEITEASSDVISLATLSNKLFAVIKSKSKSSIQYCSLEDNGKHCNLQIIHSNEKLVEIKSRITTRKVPKSPCADNNGECEHLCLLTSDSNRYSCACSLGWKLNPDLKTCTNESIRRYNFG